MPDSVQHFEIMGDNPEKLASFYEEVFDWKFEPVPGMEYWAIKTVETDEKNMPTKPGAINGGLMKRPMPDAPRAFVNYVTVKSLEESLGLLQRQGGTVIRPKSAVPKMGWFAVVTDPEMNVFGIWQDDKNAA
jgi:predicted enzyme related to lactoylglutathione lyase